MKHSTRSFALVASAAAIAGLAACSSVPVTNPALEQARGRLTSAQADNQVRALAPDELGRATESMKLADKANAEGDKPVVVNHLAYLANQRVSIANETAISRAAQAVTSTAGAERDRLRLESRTQEADRAQQQLDVSRQDNVRKGAELARADSAVAAADSANAKAQATLAQLREINGRQTERGIVVTLGDLLFRTGQSQLIGGGDRSVTKLAEFMKRNPQRKATIDGYTDSVGSSSSNLDLSDRRAQTVMAALVARGVQADRLTPQGHGEEQPIASNDTADGRAQNRRVEVVFAPEPGDVLGK